MAQDSESSSQLQVVTHWHFDVANRLNMQPRLKYVFDEEASDKQARNYGFEIRLSCKQYICHYCCAFVCQVSWPQRSSASVTLMSKHTLSCMIGTTRRLGLQEALSPLADDEDAKEYGIEPLPNTGYQLTDTSITFYSPVHHEGDTRDLLFDMDATTAEHITWLNKVPFRCRPSRPS